MPTPLRHRLLAAVSVLALAASLALGLAAPLAAQETGPDQVAQAEAPPDWQRGEFLDVRYSVPPGWQEVQRDDESFILFGGDMQTRTGPAFGMRLIDDIAEFLDTAPPASEPVVFAGGRRFDRFTMVQDLGGTQVEGDLIISTEPYWQGKYLAITFLAYNGALDDQTEVFGQILAAISPPSAEEMPRWSLLEGSFRIALPPGWDLREGDRRITLNRPDAMGLLRLSRHAAVAGQDHLNEWFIPTGTTGTPVTLLGQPALMYEWAEDEADFHDGSDAAQNTRVYVFETCAKGPETLAIEISGLPSFFASADLNDLLDGIEVVANGSPCDPSSLPQGAQPGTSGERADGRAGLLPAAGAVVPSATTAEEVKGTALDGLVSYVAPPGWFAMTGTNNLTLIHPDGRGFVTVARGTGVLAPDGIVGQMPPGRMGSFFSGYYKEWTEFGWPPATAEFMDNGQPAEGWHFVRIARECLPGQEPVAIHFAGIDRFRTGETLQALLNGLDFHWPEAMETCTLADAGYGQSIADAVPDAAPEPAPEPQAESVPEANPGTNPAAEPAPEALAEPSPEAAKPLLPPPPVVAAPMPEPDSFTEGSDGYTQYQNARYGTFISYPGTYYIPEPAPGSGDGRTFVSADGASRFFVFAQYEVMGLTQDDLMNQDESTGGYDDVTYRASGAGWYVLSGHIGTDIFYRRVLFDPSGLIQVFQITYPTSLKDSFDPVVSYMADSFGPGTSFETDSTGADPAFDDEVFLQPVQVDRLMTPSRNTDLRRALMDAARTPIAAEIGQDIIFVVSVLRTDGTWAYLQAEPRNPDGSAIDWSGTPFAGDMRNGVMSDVAMVLLRNDGSEWGVFDYIFGPSDVYWVNWANAYQLDEALFQP